MSKVFFEPIHSSYHFKKYRLKHKNLIVTKQVSDTILSLPMYPDLTKTEIYKITNSIIDVIPIKDNGLELDLMIALHIA